MEGVHISHDTKVDDYVTFGYGTKVAGDCEVHSAVIFSSGVIVNSNVRIGGASMVTGGVRISRDVPPFIVATDNPVRYAGVNETLLKYCKCLSSCVPRSDKRLRCREPDT